MEKTVFGEKLYALRTAARMTQAELAAVFSVSGKTVSKWERGDSMPDIPTLVRIASHFGVGTDDLLGLATHMGEKDWLHTELQGLSAGETAVRLFDLFRSGFAPAFENLHRTDETSSPPLPAQKGLPRDRFANESGLLFTVASDCVNIGVMLFCNRANFAWLRDTSTAEKIGQLLAFLQKKEALCLLFYLASDRCPARFTADYVAKMCGLSPAVTADLLEDCVLCRLCVKATAHLCVGDTALYERADIHLPLALVSLAYEMMCGTEGYNYHIYADPCMVKGEPV